MLYLSVGMRIRLTRNMQKRKGFFNGAFGVVERMLHRSVFVMLDKKVNGYLSIPLWTRMVDTFGRLGMGGQQQCGEHRGRLWALQLFVSTVLARTPATPMLVFPGSEQAQIFIT